MLNCLTIKIKRRFECVRSVVRPVATSNLMEGSGQVVMHASHSGRRFYISDKEEIGMVNRVLIPDSSAAAQIKPDLINQKLKNALASAKILDYSNLGDDKLIAKIVELEESLNTNDLLNFRRKIAEYANVSVDEFTGIIDNFKARQIAETPIYHFFPGFPHSDLCLPFNYHARMDPATNNPMIVTYGKKRIVVAPVAAFPVRVFIPYSRATLDHPELYQLVRYNPATGKWEEVQQVVKKSYLCHAGSIHHLANIGLSVGSANASELAKFFQLFIDNNAKNIEIVETVRKFGWVTSSSGEKWFAPFSGSYKVVPASGDLAESSNFEGVKLKSGSREEAVAIVRELGSNQVFLTMLAGMFAGPVVSLIKDYLQEGIGIDLSGKTSKGKTSIQKIAFNLVYGNADLFTRSWHGATPNGIWGVADMANHLPFILDDSHLISKHLADMPHALINGPQGDKMQVNPATNELSIREQKSVLTVIFFNGEVPLSEQTLISNSRGLLGRVFMIRALPFPDTFTSEQVRAYVRRSFQNRGQFRDEWLAHLAKLDPEIIIEQVIELTELFEGGNASTLYGRLTSKAAMLYWSLKEANEVLDLGLNPDTLIPFLIEQMSETATNGDIIREIVRDVAEHVRQNSAEGETFHPHFTPNRLREGFNCKDDDHFYVKRTCLERIVAGRRNIRLLIDELYKEGYLKERGSSTVTFKTEYGSTSSTSGYAFRKQEVQDKTGIDVDGKPGTESGQKPKMVLTDSKEAAEEAKKAYAGTNTPIIRAPIYGHQYKRSKKA